MSRVLDSSISWSLKCQLVELSLLMVSPLGYTLSSYDLPSYDCIPLWVHRNKAPDFLSSRLPKSQFLKCRNAYASTSYFFHIFEFSKVEVIRSLVHRIPKIPNPSIPELSLPGFSPSGIFPFPGSSRFVLSRFPVPKYLIALSSKLPKFRTLI